MQLSNNSLQWSVSFIRLANHWEVELVTSFFNLLYSFRWSRGGDDRMFWIPSKRRRFEVRSSYKALSLPVGSHFCGRTFGEIRLLQRVVIFVWKTALGNILTLDNLRKRHVFVMD